MSPDLADAQVPFGSEADVVIEPVRRKPATFLEPPETFVVLLARKGRGLETDNDAHAAFLLDRVRRP